MVNDILLSIIIVLLYAATIYTYITTLKKQKQAIDRLLLKKRMTKSRYYTLIIKRFIKTFGFLVSPPVATLFVLKRISENESTFFKNLNFIAALILFIVQVVFLLIILYDQYNKKLDKRMFKGLK